jgi:hypothetical protein
MLERAAGKLVPDVSAKTAATYGSLCMRAAVTAARARNAERAREHLAEAERAAGIAREGVYLGTAFGPASVRIHSVSLAVELGDDVAALRHAAAWSPPPDVPAERRSHFHVDMARARMTTGDIEQVLRSLHRARAVAPEHIQSHPQVHELLRQVLRTGRRHRVESTDFARWARLPEFAN